MIPRTAGIFCLLLLFSVVPRQFATAQQDQRDAIDTALTTGDREQSRRLLQNFVIEYPGDPQAGYQLGMLLSIENHPDTPRYLEVALNTPEYTSRARMVYATWQETAELADAERLRRLSAVLVELEAWPFAEWCLNDLLAVSPLDWSAYAYRGYVRDQQGKNGRLDIETAIGLAPDEPLPFYFLGLHWRDVRLDVPVARELLVRAYFMDPDNSALALEVAQTMAAMHDYESAAEWYDLAVALDPENDDWYRIRAAFYADTGFLLENGRMTLIQESYDRNPNDPDVLTSLGRGFYLLERYEDAEEYLGRAIQLTPNNLRTRLYFGDVLRHRGDVQGAIDSYVYVVQNAPEDNRLRVTAERLLTAMGEPLP